MTDCGICHKAGYLAGCENSEIELSHIVDTKCKITRDSGNAVRCTCTRSAADLTAFNGRPGLRPTRCQRALVRVIAAAQVLYANRISTYDNGSCGVRALAELILRPSWSTVATSSELVATVEHNDSESHRLLSECTIRAASRMKMTDDSSCGVRSSAELIL